MKPRSKVGANVSSWALEGVSDRVLQNPASTSSAPAIEIHIRAAAVIMKDAPSVSRPTAPSKLGIKTPRKGRGSDDIVMPWNFNQLHFSSIGDVLWTDIRRILKNWLA